MADSLKIEWEGADGSVWDLLDGRDGVLATSITGMGMPAFTHQWSKSAARDGSRYESTIWDNNSVALTVRVGDVNPPYRRGQYWRELDRAWRKAFSAEKEGRLVVTSEVGRRYLNLRLEGGFPAPDAMNPALHGRAFYVIGLTAGDSPWWLGDPIEEIFEWGADEEPFFYPEGEPAPEDPDLTVGLYIAADSRTDTATLSNPGDREAWPMWWVRGPADAATIGIEDEVATIPFRISGNRKVYVDSFRQTIVDDRGTNLWPLMGFSDPLFSALPAGGEATLSTLLTKAEPGAAVAITIIPRYEHPW